jgi:small-conductance mechanosensitive channel
MQQATAPVQDMGQAMMSSLTTALGVFMGVIPKLFAFFVILIVGWLVAAAVAGVVGGVLRGMKFNDLADRSGFSDFVRKMGPRTDASGFIAQVARWFVRLITLIVAFDALGLPAVSQVLQQMLLWLPNAAVALAILVIGGVLAGALAGLVRGATASAELGNPDVLATITRVGVWAFTLLVAINQLGVATQLVGTLFMGVVGALALALGLAFGLGGRDTASEIVRGMYAQSQRARPRRDGAPRVVPPASEARRA